MLPLPTLQLVRAIPLLHECYARDRRVMFEEAVGMFPNTPSERVVAVCGTDSLDDIIADLWVKMEHADLTPEIAATGAKIHAGFLRVFKKECDEIVQACLPAQTVTLVGHSLGGALACMAAHVLTSQYRLPLDRVRVITLGCPRIGNRHWAKHYNMCVPLTWRIATEADPITRLPPPWGWRHVGHGLRFRANGKLAMSGWAAVVHLLHALRCKMDVHGHSLDDYTETLRQAAAVGTL